MLGCLYGPDAIANDDVAVIVMPEDDEYSFKTDFDASFKQLFAILVSDIRNHVVKQFLSIHSCFKLLERKLSLLVRFVVGD